LTTNTVTLTQHNRKWLGLVSFLVICYLAAAIASLAMYPALQNWYESLQKPAFTPPRNVFGPVWSALYGMMAVAAWLVWRRHTLTGARTPLFLFGIQLVLNVLWSYLFFGARAPGLALVEIVLLWIAIGATTLSFRAYSGLAAALMLPYWAWVTYAAVLNFSIYMLNR